MRSKIGFVAFERISRHLAAQLRPPHARQGAARMGVARAPLSSPPPDLFSERPACAFSSGIQAILAQAILAQARRDFHVVLVPDKALGALELKAFLRGGGGRRRRVTQGLEPCDCGAPGTRHALLWAATHSTLPSEATHFSRPHCISLGSWHCSSTCVRVRVKVRVKRQG